MARNLALHWNGFYTITLDCTQSLISDKAKILNGVMFTIALNIQNIFIVFLKSRFFKGQEPMVRTTMKRLLCLLLLTLVSMPLRAETPHFRVDTAYHHASDRNHSVDELNSLDFKPYDGKISLGFKSGETWVRLRITPDANGPLKSGGNPSDRLILMVGPHFVDQLDFFEQINGQWTVKKGGDQRDQTLKICPIDLHCFEFSNVHGDAATANLKGQYCRQPGDQYPGG